IPPPRVGPDGRGFGPDGRRFGRPRRPPGSAPGGGPGEFGPPPPPGSQVIVMDIPKIVEDATRAATAAGVTAADPKIRAMIDQRTAQQLASNQQELRTMAEALSRDAAARASGEKIPVEVEGRWVEVAVQKDGRVIGRANATLNLDRTLHTVLSFARRDQGEIPFAIDRQGVLYTPESRDKARLP